MATYVDRAAWYWKGRYWCHLTADSLAELHQFAAELGLKPEWFQAPPKTPYPHYDLTESKRSLAIELGSVELLDRVAFLEKVRGIRSQWDLQQEKKIEAPQA